MILIFSKEYPKSCIVNANPVDCLKVCFNDMKVLLILMVVMMHSKYRLYPEGAISELSLPFRFLWELFDTVVNVPHLWMFFFHFRIPFLFECDCPD